MSEQQVYVEETHEVHEVYEEYHEVTETTKTRQVYEGGMSNPNMLSTNDDQYDDENEAQTPGADDKKQQQAYEMSPDNYGRATQYSENGEFVSPRPYKIDVQEINEEEASHFVLST
jgi:hypothetical protein